MCISFRAQGTLTRRLTESAAGHRRGWSGAHAPRATMMMAAGAGVVCSEIIAVTESEDF